MDSQAAQLLTCGRVTSTCPTPQLYDARKDRAVQLRMLLPMLRALTHPWEVNKSPLGHGISPKAGEKKLGPG